MYSNVAQCFQLALILQALLAGMASFLDFLDDTEWGAGSEQAQL